MPGGQKPHFRHCRVALSKKNPRGHGKHAVSLDSVQSATRVWFPSWHAEHGRHGALPPGENRPGGHASHTASSARVQASLGPLPGGQSVQAKHVSPRGE